MIRRVCLLIAVTAIVQGQSPQPPLETKWAYLTRDGYGTTQEHEETIVGDNARRGSYGYVDPNGVYRRVNYVADANGFRAQVNTNEPGTANRDSADAQVNAQPPPGQPPVPTAPQAPPAVPAAPVFQVQQGALPPPAVPVYQSGSQAPYWYNQQPLIPRAILG